MIYGSIVYKDTLGQVMDSLIMANKAW